MQRDPQSGDIHGWHLDKRIPIALIVAMFAQVFAAGVFIANILSTQTDHDKRLTNAEVRIEAQSQAANTLGNRITRIESQNENILDAVRRIEGYVRQPRRPGD